MRGMRLLVPILAILLAMASALIAPHAAAQKRGGTRVMIVQPEPPSRASYQNTSAPIGHAIGSVRIASPVEGRRPRRTADPTSSSSTPE